jgi:serine protease
MGWQDSETLRIAELDPAGEPKGTVFPTLYVADELLVDTERRTVNDLGDIEELARAAGWQLEFPGLSDPLPEWSERTTGAAQSVRVRITTAPDRTRPATTPDAWQILRQARLNGAADGVSLNHVISTDSMGLNPFKANPFKANPFKANPFKANPFKANAAGVGIDSYAALGFGGRQPVTYVGPEPRRSSAKDRPVVAILDTGCGTHPWFRGDVLVPPYLDGGEPIGLDDPATDPERHPTLGQPLDGLLDDAAGHGTFIAGLIRQECPDARILPIRIADGEGIILESEVIAALGRLLQFMAKTPVAVLNLSFGFFHETPGEAQTLSEIGRLLEKIRGTECVVVCSAGNEATDRPAAPASLAPDDPGHLAVGALNPSGTSVAMFSNVGDWVDVYAPGVSLVSTVPVSFEGSVQAGMRDDRFHRRRETLDADDFGGGFAVWSGTSFAAPVVAGRIARMRGEGLVWDEAVSRVRESLAQADHSRQE